MPCNAACSDFAAYVDHASAQWQHNLGPGMSHKLQCGCGLNAKKRVSDRLKSAIQSKVLHALIYTHAPPDKRTAGQVHHFQIYTKFCVQASAEPNQRKRDSFAG